MFYRPRLHPALWALLISGAVMPVTVNVAIAEESSLPAYSPEKELDPDNWHKQPLKFGSFLLFNELEVTEYYNDNLFATKDDKKADLRSSINPSVQLVNYFGAHHAGLSLGAEARFHNKYTDENQINYDAHFSGAFNPHHTIEIPFSLSHIVEHINRNDSSQIGVFSREPEKVKNHMASLGLNYKPGRFEVSLMGEYWIKRIPNGDTVLPAAGITAIGKDKDKDTLSFKSEVSYQTDTQWRPLARLEYQDTHYKHRLLTTTGLDGAVQDNKTYRTLAGLSLDYKGLVKGNILAGYEWRSYEEPGADDVTGFSMEVGLKFKPTERTNLGLHFLRKSSDDNILLTGVKQNILELALEQELNSRWSALLEGDYIQTDYLNLDREDDYYSAQASLTYKVQRGLFLEGALRHSTRTSTDSQAEYDQNVITVGVKKQF